MKIKYILICLIVIIISILNLDGDLFKLVLTGHSATYGIIIIKHNYFLGIILSFIIVGIVVYSYFKKNRISTYLLIIFIVFWIISMKTYAVVNIQKPTIISGFAFIPLGSCELKADKNPCVGKYDFFLHDRLKTEIEKTLK